MVANKRFAKERKDTFMKTDSNKIGVILIVFALVVAVVIIKTTQKREAAPSASAAQQMETQAGLPQVLDFGKGTCAMCKKMAPIMEELKKEYEGRVVVKVINIAQRPEFVEKFKIRLIPTQVFLDAEGRRKCPPTEVTHRTQAYAFLECASHACALSWRAMLAGPRTRQQAAALQDRRTLRSDFFVAISKRRR